MIDARNNRSVSKVPTRAQRAPSVAPLHNGVRNAYTRNGCRHPGPHGCGQARAKAKVPARRDAAEQLNEMRRRMCSGFVVMNGGNDKARPWQAKAYLSVVRSKLRVSLKGPMDTIDECKTITVTLDRGESCSAATCWSLEETGQLRQGASLCTPAARLKV